MGMSDLDYTPLVANWPSTDEAMDAGRNSGSYFVLSAYTHKVFSTCAFLMTLKSDPTRTRKVLEGGGEAHVAVV